jgi:ribosomal-protein-alanine N-acetyltransferase
VREEGGVIRPLVPADADELAALLVSNRAFLAPYQPDQAESFFTPDGQRDRIRIVDHLYGIVDDVRLAGTISLSNVIHGAFRSAHVGYWVDESQQGRGLATHAVGAVSELAFGELGLHRLEAATLVENAPSQRVLEKNRFTRIGVAPRYLHISGAWRDHVLFQRTAED